MPLVHNPLDESAASRDSGYDDFLALVGGDAPPTKAAPAANGPPIVRGATKDTVAGSEDESSGDGSYLSGERSGPAATEAKGGADDRAPTEKVAPKPAVSFGAAALEEEAARQREAAVAAALAHSSTRHIAATAEEPEVKSKSWRALEAQAKLKAKASEKYVLPGDAPEATKYFDRQVDVRAAEIEAARKATREKAPEKQLPIDYFTKMGEAETAAKAKSMRDLAQSQADKGTLYFTAKAEEEKKAALAKHAEGHSEMSVATKYFNKLAVDKKAEEERKAREDPEPMPAAIQKFTMEAYKQRAKSQREIRALHDNPVEMAPGQAYFTNKMMAEKAKRDAENQALRENPPPSSEATAYFAEKEKQRQRDLEQMMQEPAPAAVEYFTKKADEEQERAQAAMERSNAKNEEASVATTYFERQKSVKEEEIKANREVVNNKPYEEPLPIDYFTKLGEAETAAQAKSMRDLAQSQADKGTLYFTAKAEEERAAALAKHAEGHPEMSVATKYFNNLAAEKKAEEERKAREEPEPMPAAIQKFTMEAYKKREKSQREIRALRDNPVEMAPGQAYFTNKMMAEKEARDAENQALRDNPPPTSEATAYFAKREIERKQELEAMANEPAPAAVEFFTNKAREEQERAEEAMRRASARGEEKQAATSHFEQKEVEREREIEKKRKEAWERRRKSDGKSKIDWASIHQQKAPEVNLYYTVDEAMAAEFSEQ